MIHRSLVGSYTPNLFMLPMPCSFGGMNKPAVYTYCCGSYLAYKVLGMGDVWSY